MTINNVATEARMRESARQSIGQPSSDPYGEWRGVMLSLDREAFRSNRPERI